MRLSLATKAIAATCILFPASIHASLAKKTVPNREENTTSQTKTGLVHHDLDTTTERVNYPLMKKGQNSISRNLATEQWQLINIIEGEAALDRFGKSVSISGDGTRVAVGAWGANVAHGHVKVYNLVGDALVQKGSTVAINRYSYFGKSVAMSEDGSRFAAAASFLDSAFVYELVNGDWKQVGDQVICPGTGAKNVEEIAISGDGKRFILGNARGSLNNKGAVFVFEDVNNQWNLVGEIDGKNDNENFGFGLALSYDGMRLVAGAPYALDQNPSEGAGLARVYEQINSVWSQVGVDLELDVKKSTDKFGRIVSISGPGNLVAVGGYAKKVGIYKDNGSGVWQRVILEGAEYAFGHSVSISADGNRVATSSSWYDAEVYEDGGSGWEKVGDTFRSTTLGIMDISISSDGSKLAIGNGEANSYKGAAALFGLIVESEVPSVSPTFPPRTPTSPPTPSPTSPPTPSPSSTPTSPPTPAASCVDSPLKVLTGQYKKSARTCTWIMDNKPILCDRPKIASHCPASCGKCEQYGSADSKGKFIFNRIVRDCAWVKQQACDRLVFFWNLVTQKEAIMKTCRGTAAIFN